MVDISDQAERQNCIAYGVEEVGRCYEPLTNDQAELQNCITNAQNLLMEMGPVIDRISGQSEKNRLKELCSKAGTLLKEAHQRF